MRTPPLLAFLAAIALTLAAVLLWLEGLTQVLTLLPVGTGMVPGSVEATLERIVELREWRDRAFIAAALVAVLGVLLHIRDLLRPTPFEPNPTVDK